MIPGVIIPEQIPWQLWAPLVLAWTVVVRIVSHRIFRRRSGR